MFFKDADFIDLETAFFPVELRGVFVERGRGRNDFVRAPRHAAVVDVENEYVFALVTDGYRLVHNREAVDIGGEIMERVFLHVGMKDMKCFNMIMPETRSFCHIDLVYTGLGFEVFSGDSWTPFLRVTNSYNRTRRLRFDLGFCRWMCRNGMIFGAESIHLSDSHSHAGVDRLRYDEILRNIGSIRQIEGRLLGHLNKLKRYHVPPSAMLALFCKAFNIKVPPDVGNKRRQAEDLSRMAEKIDELTDLYFADMGHHAYAALNVLTDFAARPVGVISMASTTHGYQVAAARWMEAFAREISAPTFDIEAYLGGWQDEAFKVQKIAQEVAGQSAKSHYS